MMRIVAKHNERNIPTNESLVHLGQLFWHVVVGPGRVWGGGGGGVREGGVREGGVREAHLDGRSASSATT